jgi:hypothetical protein
VQDEPTTQYVIWDIPGPLAWLLGAAVALIVIAVVWMAAEAHYRSCVEAAQAEFPGVPVSAFIRDPADVGPLKLSFAEERADAVDGCSRFFL